MYAHRTMQLEPELTIYSAAALRQALYDALADGAGLTLDLGQVCEIDSAGVQLLIAAARHAAAAGQPFALTGHSTAVQDAFELLGLNLDTTPAGRPA